ncbi:Hypothetical predicted protein, partial [Mytilus galloprovincialis]
GSGGHGVFSNVLRGQPNVLQKKKSSVESSQPNVCNLATRSNRKEEVEVEVEEIEDNLHISDNAITYSSHPAPTKDRKLSIHNEEECKQDKPDVVPDVSKLDHYTICADILGEIRKGRYIIEVAPSDLVDFGGQRSYDMTHQLFIQHRGSFIIMFNGKYELKTPLKEYPQGDVTSESGYARNCCLDEGEDDIEIRKVGGKRYVTEERLTQFERGMKDSITQSITQAETVDQVSAIDKIIEVKDITTRNGPCGDEFDALTHDLSLNLLFEGFDELQKSTPSDVIGSAEPSQAIEKNIVIDRVRAATITVPLVINKVETKAVIDTGAEVTVLSEELYSKIPKDMRPELKKATRNLVVAEAGKHMTTRGIAQIEMKLGNEIFTWPMGLQLNGEWIECQTTRQIDGIARVRIKEAITIPANSEIIIAGEGYDTEGLSSRYSILEPVVEDSRKIMVARTLVDAHSCKVPVRLINLDEHPVKLRKNYLLGELHPVQDISEVIDLEEKKINRCGTSTNSCSIHSKHSVTLQDFLTDQGNKEAVKIPESWTESSEIRKISGAENDGNQMNKVDIQMMPDFLQDLYERSSKNLTDEVNRQKLRDLLLTNKDAFASNRTELGTCALVKHKIDTAGAAPIRQPLRRTPIRFEGEEMKNLKDQLDNGVIRPSTSPWASNVVLVRKKDQTIFETI